MHVHISALNAIVFLAYLVILGFLIRTFEYKYPDSEIGKALSFIY